MKPKLLKITVRWVWLLAISGAVAYYAISRREVMLQASSMLGWESIGLASVFIVIAKLGLVENMRYACSKFGIQLSWWDCFRIYNHTQLAKYVPGSIWQFVGRIAILKNKGYGANIIRDTLLAEQFWVVLVAAVAAVVPVLAGYGFYTEKIVDLGFIDQWGKYGTWTAVSVIGVVGTIIITVMWGWARYVAAFIRWLMCMVPSWQVVVILLLTWMSLGASLWITLKPFVHQLPPYPYIFGLYCFAYLAGFLVPFAPAGIGVREGVLALGLSVFVNTEIALLLAVVNRLIYFTSELFLAASGFCKNIR